MSITSLKVLQPTAVPSIPDTRRQAFRVESLYNNLSFLPQALKGALVLLRQLCSRRRQKKKSQGVKPCMRRPLDRASRLNPRARNWTLMKLSHNSGVVKREYALAEMRRCCQYLLLLPVVEEHKSEASKCTVSATVVVSDTTAIKYVPSVLFVFGNHRRDFLPLECHTVAGTSPRKMKMNCIAVPNFVQY